MEITLENAKAAYNVADESGKRILAMLIPELNEPKKDNRPITERVKTFEDACKELGEHPLVSHYNAVKIDFEGCDFSYDLLAYLKLRIICAALNEGWEPQFTEDETRYYPWFWLYDEDELSNEDKVNELKEYGLISTDQYQTEYAGFASAYSASAPSCANASIGSRLCLKTPELARYCGKRFSDIWADFNLIRK